MRGESASVTGVRVLGITNIASAPALLTQTRLPQFFSSAQGSVYSGE